MNTSSESRGGTGAGSAAAARVNHKAFWLFPDVDRTLVSRMRMDDVAMYSTTDQRSADQICDCLAGLLPDLRSCSVLDATACSGGSTFAFSRRFGRVEAVELDRQRFLDMVHNLRTLGVRVSWVTPELCRAPSIQVIRGDAVERLAAALPGAYDVVFVDPPWGGPHVYRATPLLQLSLSGIPLSRVVRDALKRRTARFVALKVPANFDVSEMEEGSGGCVWADRSIGGGRMRLLVLSAAAEEVGRRFKHKHMTSLYDTAVEEDG